jgi:hypothetical protein
MGTKANASRVKFFEGSPIIIGGGGSVGIGFDEGGHINPRECLANSQMQPMK